MDKANKNNPSEDKRFPIIWATGLINKKGRPFNLGVCGYCWKPCFIGSDIDTITIHDLFLNEQTGICEEGQRCLNVNCRFNITTPKSYAINKGWHSDEGIKQVAKLWARITKDLKTNQPIADECKKAYDDDHNIGAIEFQKRRDRGDGK